MSQPREPGSSLCHSAGTAQALGHGSGPSPALRLCLLQCQQSQPLSGRQLPAAPGWVCIPSRAGRSPRGAAGEAGAADGLEALVIFQNLFWDAIHCSSLGKDDLQAELLWPNELGGINWSPFPSPLSSAPLPAATPGCRDWSVPCTGSKNSPGPTAERSTRGGTGSRDPPVLVPVTRAGAATHLPTRPLTWHWHPGARSSLASTSWQIIFCKSSCPHHVPGLPVSQQKIHSDSQP